jgi:hypothetical protein
MTYDTLTFPRIETRTCYTDLMLAPLIAATNRAEEVRQERLQRLVEWSTSDDGLDWDALARINIEGWGSDDVDE